MGFSETKIAAPQRPVGATLDFLFAFLAIGGITATVLADMPMRTSADAASDLKTLQAAAWCFRHGLDAYSFTNVQAVFQAQGMALPGSWFGHAPVYPPTTLAILVPLTLVSMATGAYCVTVGSALLFALALFALLRYSARAFDLNLGWRAALAGACAAGPLLAFALSVGNMSVAASALLILVFVRRGQSSVWVLSSSLALALLLKPHLAIWTLLGMLLLPETRGPRIALRAAVLSVATGLGAAEILAPGQLLRQTRSCMAMVGAEMAPGNSMNLSSRELLAVFSQITSLRSLFGFWTAENWLTATLAITILFCLAGFLVWHTRGARTEAEALLAVVSWSAFGLLATYHRAHDAILLLLLGPWLIASWRAGRGRWRLSGLLLLYGALSLGPSTSGIGRTVMTHAPHALASFLALRQAAVAELFLVLILFTFLGRAPLPSRTP